MAGVGDRCRFSAKGLDALNPKTVCDGTIIGEGRNGPWWIVKFDDLKTPRSLHKDYVQALHDETEEYHPALDKIIDEDRVGHREFIKRRQCQ